MTSFGYNTAAMAQRYFSVEDERASRKIALLCFSLFLGGAFIWFVPPFAMRVLHPDLGRSGRASPTRTSPPTPSPRSPSCRAASSGIMLAAMFSATMSSLSGLLNIHASIISKDIFPTLFPRRAGEAEKLDRGLDRHLRGRRRDHGDRARDGPRAATRVFGAMVTFNTVMSLAYGPPALLGLVVRRTPSWSGLASFAVALAVGAVGSFVLGWGLVDERGHGRAGLGRRLLPEPALPGDGPGPRRAARRPLPPPRHAGRHGGGARATATTRRRRSSAS